MSMVKTSKEYFNRFKKSFLGWQQKLGLIEYRVYFEYKPLDGSYAEIDISNTGKVALVTLNSKLDARDRELDEGPESHGKHEAIHLMLSKMDYLACERYVRKEEIAEELEGLVRKLEKLL